jgi:hypothetical protein
MSETAHGHGGHENESNHKEKKISTPGVKNSNVYKIIILLVLIFLALIAIPKIINRVKKENLKNAKNKNESVNKPVVKTIPDIYTEYHLLKRGGTIRVSVPSGYSYTCAGGGKKYYHQAQNSTRELWGDGKYHDTGKRVAFFDLTYYDEEITVVCEFKKQY